MPNLRTIATSTALVLLLLSCNRILPTKAYTDDDVVYTDDDGYSYNSETTSNLNVTCSSADPSSVFTSPVCYTLVSSNGTESINGTVIYFWEEYLYEFYEPELEGGPVNASVDKRIGGAVKVGFYTDDADYRYCGVTIETYEACLCYPCDTDNADDLRPTTFRIDCSHNDGGIDASDTCVEFAPYPPIYDPHLGKKDNDDDVSPIDDDVYIRDYETTSTLNVTCASPSVFTSPACYTLVSNVATESIDGSVVFIYKDYLYEFYGQELEGGPVNASVDERIGWSVEMNFVSAGYNTSLCWVTIGTGEACECSPCDTDADDWMPTTFRIDCSHIDGGIVASDTCVEFAPYPPVYDPHLGRDNNDFIFPIDDDYTNDDFTFPIDDGIVYPVDDDYVPPSKIGSLFRRFGGRVVKILAYLKSSLPSFRHGKRND